MPGLRGSFKDIANSSQRNAMNAYGSQQPGRTTESKAPGKTVGGLISSGAGMSLAGAAAGGAMGGAAGGPYGAAIGAGVGILSYMLS